MESAKSARSDSHPLISFAQHLPSEFISKTPRQQPVQQKQRSNLADRFNPFSLIDTPRVVHAAEGGSGGGGGVKKKNPWKAIVAGGISGGIEICITYPTEYVKTQMQLYENVQKQGIPGLVKDTIKNHGIGGLYRGLATLLYFSVPKSAVRFWGFEQGKEIFKDKKGHLDAKGSFLAGAIAGALEAVVVVIPMETIKVRLIHDQLSAAPKYRGFAHGVSAIVKEKGFSGIYKGVLPTVLKQGSNQMIRFGSFEIMRGLWLDDPSKKFNVLESLVAGALAGAASVFGNTPVDVVKTRMQGLEAHKYSGTLDCIAKVWKGEGIKGFYKGTVPRLGRVCADVAIVMTLYEEVSKLLDKFWKD